MLWKIHRKSSLRAGFDFLNLERKVVQDWQHKGWTCVSHSGRSTNCRMSVSDVLGGRPYSSRRHMSQVHGGILLNSSCCDGQLSCCGKAGRF